MSHQHANQSKVAGKSAQKEGRSPQRPHTGNQSPHSRMMHLQRTAGNQAVERLLQSGRLQAKLAISHPGDKYEQEADRVVEQVMRMPEPTVHRACAPCAAGGAPCPKCLGEKKNMVQLKAESSSDTASVPDNFLHGLGSGRPLDSATRAFFEPRFGHDFSYVRVHTDAQAAESARSVNALAYTVGRDVVFGAGQYAPGTSSGQRLLAHELTHVAQQNRNSIVLHRWTVGAAPAPGGFSVVTDPDQLRRLGQAEAIVRRVLTSRNCQNFFSTNCTNGAGATALQQAFDNARVYLIPVDDNAFGSSINGSNNIAFNLRAFRIGRFTMASTLLHEMFHTCDPILDPTDELTAENAVERCRLHTPWITRVLPNNAPTGARITIAGLGFGPTQDSPSSDEVIIGGVFARVISWTFAALGSGSSLVTIIAEVPAGAGGVVVVNNGVRSNTAAFTVVP